MVRLSLACFTLIATSSVAYTQPRQIGEKDTGRICKAAIAKIMGRDVRIIRMDRSEDGIAYVSYVRPNDKKQWKNRCRLEVDQVVWSTVDAFGPNSGFGPWRTRPEDEKVIYRLNGKSITITEISSDGSKSSETMVVD